MRKLSRGSFGDDERLVADDRSFPSPVHGDRSVNPSETEDDEHPRSSHDRSEMFVSADLTLFIIYRV